MIYKEGKEISGLYFAGKVITAVYAGARLVWQAVRSCYGSGAWLGDLPWLGDDPWKGN
jgi:hypothetical protein